MRPIKILLIDDDEEDYILTREILASGPEAGAYHLSWCNNYEEAINAMLKNHHDVYLIDYRLGGRSGLDLLHEAVRSNCTDPMIVLTGKGDSRTDEEALRIGATDYLTKGEITYATLTRAIRYALRNNKTIGKLKRSENKFRIFFERTTDPIMITDPGGVVYEANEAALNFLETSLEDLLKQNFSHFYRNLKDHELFNYQIGRDGSVKDMEIEIITASGKTKYCSISSFIQIVQNGSKELYYSILHDITGQKQQEELITDTPAVAEDFVQVMANEIYNPLSSINFATEELKNNSNGPSDPELLDIIKMNCERIGQVTTSLISEVRKKIRI